MKIKKVYLGRRQIYPEKDPNRLIWYKLNWDLTDSSWNWYNLTNAWSATFTTLSSWKKVLSVQNTSAYRDITMDQTKNFTIAWWVRDTASRSGYEDWTYFWIFTSSTTDYAALRKSWPSQSNAFYVAIDWSNTWTTITYNDTNWHFAVVTYDRSSSTCKMYIDNTLKLTKTLSQSRTASKLYIWKTWSSSTVKINVWEFILDTAIRDTTKIAEHYNSTKSLYGIS